jgi:SPX domain
VLKQSDFPRRPSNRASLMNKVQNRLSMINKVQTLGHRTQKTPVVPLAELLPTLCGQEKQFFDKLNFELEKIESFYLNREQEAKARHVVFPLYSMISLRYRRLQVVRFKATTCRTR